MELAYLTTQQAAEILGVSQEHVQKLCRDDKLRCQRVGGVHRAVFLIDPASVKEYATQEHKRGWKKGQPRKTKKSAAPTEGGA